MIMKKLPTLAAFLFGMLGLALLAAAAFPPRHSRVLDPAMITPWRSLAYGVDLGASSSWLYELPFDSANGDRSNLALFENGKPLGPAHASHATIEASGRGAYSHWNDILVF